MSDQDQQPSAALPDRVGHENTTVRLSPQHRLRALVAAHAAGTPEPLLLFYGHRTQRDARGRVIPGPGVLSQWYPAPFDHEGITYPHAEAFMMAAKARLFEDATTHAAILRESDPLKCKRLGRQVRGFDARVWNDHAYRIVVTACIAKFTGRPGRVDYLAQTAPAVLVEASPSDRVWGIGLRASDPAAHDVRTWRGQNLLGFALTEAREQLTSPTG